MFSKALFKQSFKANKTMWMIITFAVCFMLACVMLISGNGNIGDVKNSIQDTIITKELDSQMQKRSLSYYSYTTSGLEEFDSLFALKATDTLSYTVWLSNKPDENSMVVLEYQEALKLWYESKPNMRTETGKNYEVSINVWQNKEPNINDFITQEDYLNALNNWKNEMPSSSENAIMLAYTDSIEELKENIYAKALLLGYDKESKEANEMLGSVMYSINPNGMFDDFYLDNNEKIEEYDILSIINHILSGDVNNYLVSEERINYINDRASNSSSIFLAGNMSNLDNINSLLEALSFTKEKYESFGYSYDYIKNLANTVIITYQARLDYEIDNIKQKYDVLNDEYLSEVEAKKNELALEVSSSFLSTLPESVSDALEEIGQADLYTLIVGSIFYKLAGLLLPIIFMIMVSNNLIAGQVDSGSMAYVLSTSTKRRTVVFTQSIYLIGSLLSMFILTTITGCICLAIVPEEVGLTYSNLILLNVGAFLVLFALSGLCFLTSCFFDRSKRSMAIGGGLSIFALVAAMLGLFGSPAIPSVVRLNALNNFNYTTIISLFDVISIIEGTNTFIWKFIILAMLGVLGYIFGNIKFTKKDLPL